LTKLVDKSNSFAMTECALKYIPMGEMLLMTLIHAISEFPPDRSHNQATPLSETHTNFAGSNHSFPSCNMTRRASQRDARWLLRARDGFMQIWYDFLLTRPSAVLLPSPNTDGIWIPRSLNTTVKDFLLLFCRTAKKERKKERKKSTSKTIPQD